jgi:exopolyphosphatase/guanosine-5'-triphosphate,3'-diphosphate pyrophosphatase
MGERRLAVADLGSNSFRLVVFTWTDAWWKRTDEIYEPVRIGAGLDASGALQPEPMERALETLELFAHFCRATGVTDMRAVATSAIRDATNQAAFLEAAKERAGVAVRVLSREEEARYGYLAAVRSTTLADGVAMDIGGGSMQLSRVQARESTAARSFRLGAVRMTERFLPDRKASPKQIEALRAHVRKKLDAVDWVTDPPAPRLVGVGGAVRNLAAAVMIEQGLPTYGVQGFRITRKALDGLVDRLAELPAGERRRVPGIKPERGDVILAGALVVQAVVHHGPFKTIEATEAGLREGVFFEEHPVGADGVRAATVHNLASQYGADFRHAEHVSKLALELWDGLETGERGRDLVAAAAILHDIGTAVDYDDHHKHSRYLVLNAGLPGYDPRETALIALLCRYHRKGEPSPGELAPLLRDGDEEVLHRGAAVLRLAEQLERPRDQSVRSTRVERRDGEVVLHLDATEDTTVARWAAERQRDLFERAFKRRLTIEGP